MKFLFTLLLQFLIAMALPFMAYTQTIGVFYDLDNEQIKFAASDIKTALEAKSFTVEMLPLSTLTDTYTNKKVVIALASNSLTTNILKSQNGTIPTAIGEQAYALRTTESPSKSFWVLGGDANGAMYGGLQIAENISFESFIGNYNTQESPTILKRGIKLNYPLDKMSPTYFSGFATSYEKAIPHVWDMSYWKTWLDEMARNRFNVLSIWNNHPFSSMVKLPDYPNAAIQNVTGFDGFTKTLTIDQKIAFWKELMAYAHNRGFEFFFFNWNIFVSNANGLYGLSNGSTSAANTAYMYKCMTALLETYPELDGFGVTNGEKGSTVEFLWNTYGKAMYDYFKDKPDRSFKFIHRWHQANFSSIKTLFSPLIGLKNVTFDMSYKYSQAHMYSTPVPKWWSSGNINDLNNNGLKTWFTVRNDDFYYHNWGDPTFARAYINGIPGKSSYFKGFYMGSDGYCPTRTFFSKNSISQGKLEIQRQWYMYKLWGRLSYNPSTSDELFKNFMKLKYPTVSSDNLFAAWSKASGGLPKVTELAHDKLQLDFDWWPEACWSKDGFVTAASFASADVGEGSLLCKISSSASNSCSGKKSSYTLADEIESDAKTALELVSTMNAADNTELGVSINNIKAMAYLSIYYAYKIRGATYISAKNTEKTKENLGVAYCWWMKYANLMDAMYTGMTMQRVKELPNWHAVDAAVLAEYNYNGGVGIPPLSCEVPNAIVTLPEKSIIQICTLTSDAVYCSIPTNETYTIQVFSIEGKKMAAISGISTSIGLSKVNLKTKLSKGLYIVEVGLKNSSFVTKTKLTN